jgi:hypothetical protein
MYLTELLNQLFEKKLRIAKIVDDSKNVLYYVIQSKGVLSFWIWIDYQEFDGFVYIRKTFPSYLEANQYLTTLQ